MDERKTSGTGRTRMLDAAEILFATRGFDGTSVRDITNRAEVEVGLLPYHFKTKADLFREMLLRRAPAFAGSLNDALDTVLTGDDRSGAAMLAAYLDTHIALLRSPDAGWQSYLRLAAEAMLRSGDPSLNADAKAIYRPVMQRYEDALVAASPRLDTDEIQRIWSIFRRTLLSVLIGASDKGPGAADDIGALRRTMLDLFSRPFPSSAPDD